MKAESTITLGVEPTDTVDGVKQMIQEKQVSHDYHYGCCCDYYLIMLLT